MTKQAYTVAQALIDLGIVNVAADLATAKDDEIKSFVASQRDKLVKENDTDNDALSKIKAAMNRLQGRTWPETINAVKTLAADTLSKQEEQQLRNAVFKSHGNKAREAWEQGAMFSGIGDALAIVAIAEAIEQVGTIVAKVETKDGVTPVAFDIADMITEPVGSDGKVLRSVQEARINAVLVDVFGYKLPGDDAAERREWNQIRNAAKSRIARALPIAVLVARTAKAENIEVARLVSVDDAGVFRARIDLVRPKPESNAKEDVKAFYELAVKSNTLLPVDGRNGSSITEMGKRATEAEWFPKKVKKEERAPHQNNMGANPQSNGDFKVAFTIICGRVRGYNRRQPGYRFTDDEVNELRTLERELVAMLNRIDEQKRDEQTSKPAVKNEKAAATA